MVDGHETKHFVIYADAGHFTPTINNFKLLSWSDFHLYSISQSS